jgi:hypothetical protein
MVKNVKPRRNVMIELRNDQLVFSFPEVHPHAKCRIEFQRTLRIPDDGKDYPLPPGLGAFPLRHADDFASRVPAAWIERGGVMFPMYQSEALWLNFHSSYVEVQGAYPFVVKVAAGKINAVTGEAWSNGISRRPKQDYMVVPGQPWIDGYCVEKGVIRQFVAMPLAAGYTAEEQLTGAAEHGGLQIVVYPMKRDVFERRFPVIQLALKRAMLSESVAMPCCAAPDMGLAAGGRMKQEIYEDEFDFDDWDLSQSSRCFVHIANSMVWQSITGATPPHPPPTAKDYTRAGLPWFSYYDDSRRAVEGSKILNKLKSVIQIGEEKRDVPLPENDSVTVSNVKELRRGLRKEQVREGAF